MNNIEKQAERFGMEEDDGFAVMNADKRDGFKAGAEWMHAELTRWHDPKEDLPEPGKHVLVKRFMGLYDVDLYDPTNKRFLLATNVPMAVIAWRYIHE